MFLYKRQQQAKELAINHKMANETDQKRIQREEEEEDKYWNQLNCFDTEIDQAEEVGDDGMPWYSTISCF